MAIKRSMEVPKSFRVQGVAEGEVKRKVIGLKVPMLQADMEFNLCHQYFC